MLSVSRKSIYTHLPLLYLSDIPIERLITFIVLPLKVELLILTWFFLIIRYIEELFGEASERDKPVASCNTRTTSGTVNLRTAFTSFQFFGLFGFHGISFSLATSCIFTKTNHSVADPQHNPVMLYRFAVHIHIVSLYDADNKGFSDNHILPLKIVSNVV